jgi:hypothetical protein
MKKLLIATRNNDKYKIATSLFEAVFPDTFTFENLNDTTITHDVIETGSILERAEKKAKEIWNILDEQQKKDYFASVGIDDGFSFTPDGDGDPNSKEITDQILSGQLLNQNDTIWLKRAFAFCNDSSIHSSLTTIPLIFQGNQKNIKRQEGVYPLSQVLSPKDQKLPLSDINFNDTIQYYLKYSGQEILNLLSLTANS